MVNLTKQEAMDITLKHLIKNYGEEAGVNLLQDAGTKVFDCHGLAWSLGKEHLDYFCELFLHNSLFDYDSGKVPLSKTHLQIWDELQEAILHQNNTQHCYIFPRAFGKTSTITVPIAIWSALYTHSIFTVVASATDELAKNFIETIKAQIEDNQYIEMCFGKVINRGLRYNAEEIELDTKPTRVKIKSVSSATSIRGIAYKGMRVNLLLLDDFQDKKQIRTPEGRADMVEQLNDGLLKTLENNNNHTIAVGTIQYKDDVYYTLASSPLWAGQVEKFTSIDIDYYFTHNKYWVKCGDIIKKGKNRSKALLKAENFYTKYENEMKKGFPIIWDGYDRFAMFKRWQENPVSFKKEYQSDISCLAERRIKSLSAIPAADIESLEFAKTILSVDPASTTGKRADYSAFCILSEEKDTKIRYCRKLLIDKLEFNDYLAKVIQLLLDYPDIDALSIEKQTYSGADVVELRRMIRSHPQLSGRAITIFNKSRSKNKDARIDTIIPDINLGRIVFNEEDEEAIAQVRLFAGQEFTEHDDAIDALADAAENLNELQEQFGNYGFINFSSLGIDI